MNKILLVIIGIAIVQAAPCKGTTVYGSTYGTQAWCKSCDSTGQTCISCKTCINGVDQYNKCKYEGVNNCDKCQVNGKCLTCSKGYFLGFNTVCMPCSQFEYCAMCDRVTGDCTTCFAGYYPNPDAWQPFCNPCPTGVGISTCDSTTGVLICSKGYSLKQGKCVSSLSSLQSYKAAYIKGIVVIVGIIAVFFLVKKKSQKQQVLEEDDVYYKQEEEESKQIEITDD